MAARLVRNFIGLEQRRREAACLLRNGTSEAEVAWCRGVSRPAVSCWAEALEREGLRRAKRAGRPPQFEAAQL